MRNFKLFNFRPFVFGLIALIVGMFCAYSFFVSFWFIIGFASLALLAVVLLVTRRWYKFLRMHLSATIIIAVCFVLGFGSFGIRELVYRKNVADEGVYYISAKVVGTSEYDDNLYKTKIDNVKLYDTTSNKLVKGLNESGYIWADSEFIVGDKISFIGKYNPIRHNSIKDFSNSDAYKIARYSAVAVDGNSKNIFEKYKTLVWNDIASNMGDEEAGTAYAMLTGDTSKVEYDTKLEYRSAGIGHILAVSGLHVGFLVLLLSFLLSMCRANKKVKFSVILVVLVVFCFLCGFSYSVLRASIMSIVLLYAGLRGKQYDGFSALSFATIIVLGLIDPYQLFSVSFLLSFFSMFSIVCLSKMFDYYFSKLYPSKLSGALAIGISVSIGILPWQIYYFGSFQLFSIIVNLVTIPIASMAYMVAFVLVPISLMIPGSGFLLKLPQYMYLGVSWICKGINSLSFSNITARINPITIVIWYLTMIICSDFILLPKKVKKWASVASIVVALLLLGLNIGAVF